MTPLFDAKTITRLMHNLYTLTGVRSAVLDAEGRELFSGPEKPTFCRLLHDASGGSTCQSCLQTAVRLCREQGRSSPLRCPAGVFIRVLPIQTSGSPEAYLMIGPYLDAYNRDQQWAQLKKRLYPQEDEALQTAFFALKQCSPRQTDAYLEIVQTLKDHIDLSDAAVSGHATDQQRLEIYLDRHYMEKLSLSSISHELNIGRTKLCALAKQLPGEHTISQLITQRRIRQACILLTQSSMPISQVGEAVGISDYNYFSKVFRQVTGTTPSAYRRSGGNGNSWNPGKDM